MEPTITVTRQRLQVIDKSHLSTRLSVYISDIYDKVTARIAKASVVCFAVYTYFIYSSSLAQMNTDMQFTETSFKR